MEALSTSETFLILKRLVGNVTRFDEISLLCQNFQMFGQTFWARIWLAFGKIMNLPNLASSGHTAVERSF